MGQTWDKVRSWLPLILLAVGGLGLLILLATLAATFLDHHVDNTHLAELEPITGTQVDLVLVIVASCVFLVLALRPNRPIRADAVRRGNRRAAAILPGTAVALAVAMQLVADHGLVVLVVLAWLASFYGVAAAAWWLARHRARVIGHAGRILSGSVACVALVGALADVTVTSGSTHVIAPTRAAAVTVLGTQR